MDTKKEQTMQNHNITQGLSLPLPKKEEKRLAQAEINLHLFKAVHKELKRKDITIRQAMEWGFKAFLLASNPKEAEKLGISLETI